MGNCIIRRTPYMSSDPADWEVFDSLYLKRDQIEYLYTIFCIIDADNSDDVTVAELQAYLKLEHTKFFRKSLMAMGGLAEDTARVDFKTFVHVIWHLCSASKDMLERFAFELYDRNHVGSISKADLTEIIRDIYGLTETLPVAKKAFGPGEERFEDAEDLIDSLEHIVRESDGRITAQGFAAFARRHRAILFPAFQLQNELRNKILGERFWLRVATTRAKLLAHLENARDEDFEDADADFVARDDNDDDDEEGDEEGAAEDAKEEEGAAAEERVERHGYQQPKRRPRKAKIAATIVKAELQRRGSTKGWAGQVSA